MNSAEDRSPNAVSKEAGSAIAVLELRGLKCPLPAIRTGKALAGLPSGAVIEVVADDPLAALDLAHLCRTEGHALLAQDPVAGGGLRFRIRRGVGAPAGSEAARD